MDTKNRKIVIAVLVILTAAIIIFVYDRVQAPSVSIDTATTTTQSAVSTAQAKALPGYGADITAIQAAIVGKWKSVDDASFTREFKADGTEIDSYTGDTSATTSGTWKLFTAGNADPDFKMPAASDTTYLKITDGSEIYFFAVNKAIGNDLQLTYLDRGNTLTFIRIQ